MPTEGELLQNFKEILEMSHRVKKSEVAEDMGISEKELFRYLRQWRHLGFKIDNDLIIVEDMNLFINNLETQFKEWENNEARNIGKLGIEKISVQDYHGISLLKEEYETMMILENQIKSPIPLKIQLSYTDFGFIAQDHHVIGLSLYKQGLTNLPQAIYNLKYLKELFLASNSLKSLSETISELKTLEKLYIFANSFTTLPKSLGTLLNLKALYANNNPKLEKTAEIEEIISKLENQKCKVSI